MQGVRDKQGNDVTELMQARTPNGARTLAAGVAVKIMDMNPDRIFAAIINTGAANPVSLTLMQGPVALQGITLFPNGGVWTFGRRTDFDYRGEVYAISAAGTTISFIEQ